jgi:hypothetical protein
MVLAGKTLFVAGPPTEIIGKLDSRNQSETSLLLAISIADGSELARHTIQGLPVFDGMAACNGRLYLSLDDGQLLCLEDSHPNG